MRGSVNSGYLWWGPYNEDSNVFGSIVGSPCFWKPRYRAQGSGFRMGGLDARVLEYTLLCFLGPFKKGDMLSQGHELDVHHYDLNCSTNCEGHKS